MCVSVSYPVNETLQEPFGAVDPSRHLLSVLRREDKITDGKYIRFCHLSQVVMILFFCRWLYSHA